MFKIDQLYSTKDQILIKIAIVDSLVDLESDSYRNRHPNLKSEFESSTTIQFEMANRLSLTDKHNTLGGHINYVTKI